MKQQKAVLWDLDGTILDSLSVWTEVLATVFQDLNIPTQTREQLRPQFYGSLDNALARMSNNYHDQETLINNVLQEQLHHYENPVTHQGIEDAVALFGSLGLKQAIVTSRGGAGRGPAAADSIVKALKLDLHIETVISGDETVHHKPHPEPLFMALQNLKVDAKNAVMIGDQAVDSDAAKAAGAYSILIDHENTPESRKAMQDANPDLICTDASQLINGVKLLLKLQ